MQISLFTNGGGVIHKIKLVQNATTHYSAWFDAEYKMIDAEGIQASGRARSVLKNSPLWYTLVQFLNPAHVKILFTHAPQPNKENEQTLPEVAPGSENTSVRESS